MRILIYAGLAPSRELVLQICRPLVRHVATAITLVSAHERDAHQLLGDALCRLAPPGHVEVQQRSLEDNAQAAVFAAAHEQPYDLVVFGRLHQPVARLLPGGQSKAIAQQLQPAVLRVHGTGRPIRRILVASGGDHHTFADTHMAELLALPLGASVTLLHVTSQQMTLVEKTGQQRADFETLWEVDTPEARIIRRAAEELAASGIETYAKGRVGVVLEEILAELRIGSYDLLVIGAHRVASALDGILLEDIASDLLDVIPLPVLVVK